MGSRTRLVLASTMGIAMVLAFAVGFLPSPSNLGADAALSQLIAKQALSFTFPNVPFLTVKIADTAVQADLPVQVAGAVDNVAVAANGYRVSPTQWLEGVDGIYFGLDETTPFAVTVNVAELATGANTIYAFGDVTVLGDDPAALLFDQAAQFTLDVERLTNPDADGNGIPDDPFSVVGPGQIWIGTNSEGATVIIANLSPDIVKQNLGVPVTIGNVTVTAPSLATLIDAAADDVASELKNAEQGLLIVSAAPELGALLADVDWTGRLIDALPTNSLAEVADALNKFAEISIIYEYNGGTLFDEIEVLPGDTAVNLEWRDIVASDGDSVMFFSVATDIDNSFAFTEVVDAGWELAAGTTVASGIAVANLTELSIFAPFVSIFDIEAVIPGAGPVAGGNQAVVTGAFSVPTIQTVEAAQAAFAIYFGDPNDASTLASFVVDGDSGDVVTPSAMYVTVPPGPPVVVPTPVDVFVVNRDMPEDFDVLLDGYVYVPEPVLNAVNPATGSVAGGDVVTLQGLNLTGATSVTFDGLEATIIGNTDTTVTVQTPAHAAGLVDVAFVGAGGAATLVGGFEYGNPPEAAFVADDTMGAAPFTVQFTDQSTNSPILWAWDFGDGNDSEDQNPSNTYQNPGVYTVTLTATNIYGSDTVTRVDYITVTTDVLAPIADFTASPLNGDAPLEVQFEDATIGSPTAWAWDFESDGTVDSTEQNPVFIYEAPGVYTVTLVASNVGGSDEMVKEDYITVTTPPLFVFDITPDNAWAFGGVVARIDGVGFNTDTISGDLTVTFGNVEAEIIDGTDTELFVKVPPRAVAGAQDVVDITVSRTGDATTSSTRTNFFTYVRYTERSENFGGGAFADVTSTAARLVGGTGAVSIVLDADAPGQTATLQVTAPLAGKQAADRFVLARATKAGHVFNLDEIDAGNEIANVWYFDIHVYEATGTTAPLTAGTPLYTEVLLTYPREQGANPATLTFPVGDTDLTVDQFQAGEVVMYSLDSDYLYGSPLAAFNSANYATSGGDVYQSVPYGSEYTAVGNDVTQVASRLYSLSAFALRQDVVIDLEALDPMLVGTNQGPTSGNTQVVIEGNGGLAYIDRIVFTDDLGNKASAQATITTVEGTNEFRIDLRSPRFPSAGPVDIVIYLQSDPNNPAAVLENAFTYTRSTNIVGILLAALLAGLGLIAGGDSGGGGGGPCFIATAAYGTPLAGEIDTLRAVRDTFLLDNAAGSALVDTYYRLSPAIADAVAKSPVLAAAVRLALIPVIALAKLVLAMPHVSLLLAALATLPLLRRRARKGDAKA